MLTDYIHELCAILDIDVPKISHDTSHFQTDTTLAQVDSNGDTIYIRKFHDPNPDQLFAIAHELRHIWQMKNNEQLYFADYKTSNHLNSVEKYNLQLAEIDANAFAAIVMEDFFRLSPQWKNLPESVVTKINERISYILEN